MKKLRSIAINLLGAFIVCLAVMGINKTTVIAAGDSGPYIIVSSYEVSAGSIIPGEDFELSITIQNVDSLDVAKNVIVSITTLDGINTIYPSVPQIYVGDIAPNESKEVIFTYKVSSTYLLDTASFYTSIVSDDRTNSIILTAPVKLDDAAFTVLSKNIPTESAIGEKISASFYFRVRGESNLSNVVMHAYIDGEEIVTSQIGNVRQGASKTQNITFEIDSIGSHDLVFTLEGIDQDGMNRITELYNGTIDIFEMSNENMMQDSGPVVNIRARRDVFVMGGSAVLILILSVGIVLVIKKNN